MPKLETFRSTVIRTSAFRSFVAAKLRRVGEFFVSQGIATAGNLIYGFLCVRLLPVNDYAEFAVVFGFLGTLTVLMDIGISGTLLPLVGERTSDRQLIADYIASLRQLAHWLYIAVAPLIVVIYPLVVRHQQWSWKVVGAMVAILLVAGWCARVSGAYGAVLIVCRERRVWYRIQIISSLGGLLLLGVIWPLHWFNAFSAILINVAGIAFTGTAFYFCAQRLLGVKGHPSKEKRHEIVHLALPSMPNTIFYAFQGQISILLITWFGHSTAVAGLGALTRLSRFFLLLSQMGPLLIEPYFAKLPSDRVKRNYLGLFAVETCLCLFITGMAARFPEVFLWVLGPKYSNLRFEVLLMMAAASMAQLCGVLWTVHTARRFVYWWSGAAVIIATTGIEVGFILGADLSKIRSVLMLYLTISAAELIIQIFSGLYGFAFGPRETRKLGSISREADCA